MKSQTYQSQLNQAISNLQRLRQEIDNRFIHLSNEFLDDLNKVITQSDEIVKQGQSSSKELIPKAYDLDTLDKFKIFIQASNDKIYEEMRIFPYMLEPCPLNLNYLGGVSEPTFIGHYVNQDENHNPNTEKDDDVAEYPEQTEKQVKTSNFLEVVSKDMPNITISFETFENMFRKLKIHECSCVIQLIDGNIATSIYDATYEGIIDKYEMSFNDSDDVEIVFESGVVELSDVEYIDIHSYVLNKMLMD